jgi:hypothetical protein
MSSDKEKIIRLYVGELPLIKNIIERLGLREIFAKYIKPHRNEKIPAVDSLMILLFNITCGRQPLYELEEWVEHINPIHLKEGSSMTIGSVKPCISFILQIVLR